MEGPLYIEVSINEWREVYCTIKEKKFEVHDKLRSSVPASLTNCGEVILELSLLPEECDCKAISMSLSALSRLMKSNELPETPYFFNIYITTENLTYHLASFSDSERQKWIEAIRLLRRPQLRNPNAWVRANGILNKGNIRNENMFSNTGGSSSKSNKISSNSANRNKRPNNNNSQSEKIHQNDSKSNQEMSIDEIELENSETKNAFDMESDTVTSQKNMKSSVKLGSNKSINPILQNRKPVSDFPMDMETRDSNSSGNNSNPDRDQSESDDKYDEARYCFCLSPSVRICGIKVETIVRFLKVIVAFPFIIVSSSLNFQSSVAVVTSIGVIRCLNIMVYALPVVLVRFVLSQYLNQTVEKLTVGLYMLLFLAPVGYIAFNKVRMASSTHKVEDGTFCFRPAMVVRFSQANAYAIMGFIFEWLQHVLYVIPTGILTASRVSKISDFPPYIHFEVYFWLAVAASFSCGLILVANSILRGKSHYRFQKSELVWFFLYNISSPMFVTVITILFMGLSCDYTQNPPVLFQDLSIQCYGDKHTIMARASLMALSIYLIQHTLLPSGTFKETMRDPHLDIMFVPVYLQAHFLFKAIFCGVYVYFYTDNLTRVIVLTIINIVLLYLNNSMKPCSVEWINLSRDLVFIHASISGIQGLNYLAWPNNYSTKGMLISTLASNIIFTTIAMFVYLKYVSRSTEYMIAKAFLDLEWQVSRRGSVHPRVLEPLISLTLSPAQQDKEVAKKYIGQLVFLITYPNMRVQFQSAWGLANITLIDEDSRLKIHDAGGTKTLFEWYNDMESIAQLESLACIVNLTLSLSIVTEDMVGRYKCIPFFINLITSNKIRYAPHFSAIALANLARKESYREFIRKYGGIPALVSCIMSQDYQKRRSGCLALANMALSSSVDIEQAFTSKILIDRILKMAKRKEIETQREVIALIRNLSCHARIRPMLLEREIMAILKISKDSIYEDVKIWVEEIRFLMEREIGTDNNNSNNTEFKMLINNQNKYRISGEADVTMLESMPPLSGQVDWSTWGSKLESIFAPIFVTIPSVKNIKIQTKLNQNVKIDLSEGIPRSLLLSWRDNMSFIIKDMPHHGKLNVYNTSSDFVIYSPLTNYVGYDHFTYILQLGSLKSWAGTISIQIMNDSGSGNNTSNSIKKNSNSNKNPRDLDDIEMGKSVINQNPTKEGNYSNKYTSSSTSSSGKNNKGLTIAKEISGKYSAVDNTMDNNSSDITTDNNKSNAVKKMSDRLENKEQEMGELHDIYNTPDKPIENSMAGIESGKFSDSSSSSTKLSRDRKDAFIKVLQSAKSKSTRSGL